MGTFELLATALGLSMDAFAMAICIGLSMKRERPAEYISAGLYFGFFQALMPTLGYLLSSRFADSISAYDHWVAFILLSIIGGKMVKESFDKDGDVCVEDAARFSKMLPLAFATSVDALAAGISFAFLRVNIVSAALTIGVTTLLLSILGVKTGRLFGARFKSKAELAGGIILILMGLKVLIEHLFINA